MYPAIFGLPGLFPLKTRGDFAIIKEKQKKGDDGLKRLLAFSLALFLLIAALSSCAVTFSGSSATNAPPTDAAGTTSVTEDSTEPGSEPPETTVAPETDPAPAETGDGYSKNY